MKRSQTRTAAPAAVAAETAPNAAPFAYRDFVAAKDKILSALSRGPFYGLVTGASGTGKTSLARELSKGLERHQHQLLYLSSHRVSLLSVARHFALALRVTPKRSSLETIKVIADAVQARPTQLIAWIDEADSIPMDTLSELRTLAEFNHEVAQVFTVVLSGLPDLRTLLDHPSLFPLKRRILVRSALEGLRRDELDAFLAHRFGADHRRLPAGLADELFERARAIPALLDGVVRHALARAGRGAIADDHLREAFDVAGL